MAGPNTEDDEDGPGTDSGLRPVQQPTIRSDQQGQDAEEFDVVETDERGQPIGGAQPTQRRERERDHEEASLSEEESGQQPLVGGDDGQDGQGRPREPKRARNVRRRESRDRWHQDRQRLERENQELGRRLEALEGRVGTQIEPRVVELGESQIRQQAARLDSAIADAEALGRRARERIVTAMETSNHAELALALDDRDQALVRSTQLKNEKTQVDKLLERRPGSTGDVDGQHRDQRQQQDTRQQRQSVALPTRAQNYLRQFQQENDWFDANNADDVDSNIVRAIDHAVYKDGYDPATQDYWDEIQHRMQEKMPWRFDDGGEQQQQRQPNNDDRQTQRQPARQQVAPQRRGPPSAGVSDRAAPAGQRRTVTISPQRKDVMIQSGSIGSDGRIIDAGKYKRQLAEFARFDKENPSG